MCCSTAAIENNTYKQLFSNKAVQEDLPGRLSSVLGLPVNHTDGLSKLICVSCVKKLRSSEAFRSPASHSYLKQGFNQQVPPLTVAGSSPVRQGVRKRSKDTSGTDASPFTVQSRPSAKKSTISVGRKRLAFGPRQSRRKRYIKYL